MIYQVIVLYSRGFWREADAAVLPSLLLDAGPSSFESKVIALTFESVSPHACTGCFNLQPPAY